MKHYHKNPRQISEKQFNQLKGWLEEYGDLSGIVHNIRTDEIIGGNQRAEAMHFMNGTKPKIIKRYAKPTKQGTFAYGYFEYKGERISYRQVKWTDKKAEKANMIANKAGGTFDFDIMANLWDVPILLETGWDEKELQLGGFEFENTSQDAEIDLDRAGELLKKWKCKTGDLWQIGEHRLICGDSLQFMKMMGDKSIGAVITDPPYGINYMNLGSHKKEFGWNDHLQVGEWDKVRIEKVYFDEILRIGKQSCVWGGNYYTDYLPPTMQWFIWDKGQREFSLADFEMAWSSNWKKSKIFDYPRSKALKDGKVHPTQKPVDVMVWCIQSMEITEPSIIDPFSGSGSTMVACENLGYLCQAAEIDPKYCANQLERMSLAFPALQIRKMK